MFHRLSFFFFVYVSQYVLPFNAIAELSTTSFPPPLSSYQDSTVSSVLQVLRQRCAAEPLNLVVSLIFLLAVLHTFWAPKILALSKRVQKRHEADLLAQGEQGLKMPRVSVKAEFLHLLGEVEAVFGIWAIPLLLVIGVVKGRSVAENYLNHGVHFAEAVFVVVVMSIAATRPVLEFASSCLRKVASLGESTPLAWWCAIVVLGPLLGSFITEPAAMTISALLLGEQFYRYKPKRSLAFATVGLLFVNVSVGGLLTNFAAPPVLVVAGRWGWDTPFMLATFGWKAVLGIALNTIIYLLLFRDEFKRLAQVRATEGNADVESIRDPVPFGITAVHLLFLAWMVSSLASPVITIGGFLFFIAFTQATHEYQSPIAIRSPLLVGFFLGGLVIHGGLQGWWIEPILVRLGDSSLMAGAMVLSAFNDNAAITYLAALVPGASDSMKYAVVAGATAAGGLTLIANAPNPAGNAALAKYFDGEISSAGLLLGALIPTAVVAGLFVWL